MGKKDKNAVRYDRDGIRKVMRIRDYFADSLGMFSLNIISGLAGQMTYFYTDKVGFAAGAIATIFMINRIIGAFTDLLMGSIIDNTPSDQEKYRPWLLKAGVPAGLMLVTMFIIPPGPDWFRLAYVMIMNLLVTSILYTVIAIPYISLQMVRTNSSEERSHIGTWRAASGNISGMIVAILVIPITNILGGNETAWIKLATFCGALVTLAMLICYRYARESAVDSRHNTEIKDISVEEEEKINYKEALSKLVKNKYWIIMIILNFVTQVSWGISGASGTYYAKWIYGNDNLVAVLGGLGLIPTLLGFILLTPLVKKFGPTKLLKSMALITTIVTAARIFNPDDFVFNTAIGLITTFTGIPMMALSGVLMAMVIDYNDYKFGMKMVGRTNSAKSFTDKIGMGIGVSIIGWSLGIGGYHANMTVASESVRQAIFTFSIYIPLILSAISFLALQKFDLEERMVDIYAAIAERRGGTDAKESETTTTERAIESTPIPTKEEVVYSPLDGQIFDLKDVNDPVFSSGAMGQGVAIKPSEGVVYAPADATVNLAFATGHAFSLLSNSGTEIFIHVGINTVTMDGEGFELNVAQGQKVKAGDVLGRFDIAKINAAGLEDTTVVIISNTDSFTTITPVASGYVKPGDSILITKL